MSNANFIRKWRISVVSAAGNGKDSEKVLDVSDLKVKFHIERIGFQAINWADISIYNLDSATAVDVVSGGMRVVIEAGYQDGLFGKIFEGMIFQPTWKYENVVDYVLTLHCFEGNEVLVNNMVSFVSSAVGNSRNSRGDLLAIMKNARQSMDGQIGDGIDQSDMPRGKVFFGDPKKYFRQYANASNAQWSYVEGKVVFSRLCDAPAGKAIVISPDTGLIGSPIQTPEGVHFRTLLNPSLKVQLPPMQVYLKNSIIEQTAIRPPGLQTRINQDGYYMVSSVVHTGDTRGDEWYTDIIGFTSAVSAIMYAESTGKQIPYYNG